MPWSSDISTRTVTGAYKSASGSPARGRVTFRPTTRVVDEHDSTIVEEAIVATLDLNGQFSIELPTTDNRRLRPTDWAYEVTIRLYGVKPQKYVVKIPYGDGSAVSLNSLSQTTNPAYSPVLANIVLPNLDPARPDTWATDFTTRQVIATFENASGLPAQGRITFTPTSRVTDSNGSILVEDPIVVNLNAQGSMSIDLPTTDNPNVVPRNWAYEVNVRLHGVKPQKYLLKVPYGTGEPINLANVIVSIDQDIVDVPAQNSAILRGPIGPMGPKGDKGSSILTGEGPPTNDIGVDGDYYIDQTDNAIYGPKSGGEWSEQQTLTTITKRHVHTQAVASATWTIIHPLGGRPSVTVVDSSGTVALGEVNYNNDQTVVVSFTAPFSGYAYLT